ncbi:hypothetical protein Tco_0651904 [Tanacetum coccineum]|uniref:Uncharacterized protein n=1 Tax=Tanacetum coccineum TaxID=301880 RepID=A0ABQ4WWA0_9ASTR
MTNDQAVPFDLDSPMAMKLHKRENNLMNWKWDEVIVIEDLDDNVREGVSIWEEDNNNNKIVSDGVVVGEEVVDEEPNATLPVNEVFVDETASDDIVDDDVPKERVKRTNIPRFKITGKRRLYRLIDEDEDDEDIYGHA